MYFNEETGAIERKFMYTQYRRGMLEWRNKLRRITLANIVWKRHKPGNKVIKIKTFVIIAFTVFTIMCVNLKF